MFFLFSEQGLRTVGYRCYDPIAGTQGSFDLYWIAVVESCRGPGGTFLLTATDKRVRRSGGRNIYLEISGRSKYGPTQAFKRNSRMEAIGPDFYQPATTGSTPSRDRNQGDIPCWLEKRDSWPGPAPAPPPVPHDRVGTRGSGAPPRRP